MTSKEKIEKAWELVNSKHIETNDEIQLVRYAVRMARDLVERDKPKIPNYKVTLDGDVNYSCPVCRCTLNLNLPEINGCPKCLQRLDWSFTGLKRNGFVL